MTMTRLNTRVVCEYTASPNHLNATTPKVTRIGVFAQGQILWISLNGLQAVHCDAPPFLDDRKSLSIAFLAISDQCANSICLAPPAKWQRSFTNAESSVVVVRRRPSTFNNFFCPPRGECHERGTGHRIHVPCVCVYVCPSVPNRGGTLYARLSPTRFIYFHTLDANQLYNHCRCATYLSFSPWLLFQIQDNVTNNFVFLHTLYKTGGTLCVRLGPNRFAYFHILGANQLYNHCRCATYLSFWPWLYFRSRTRSQKTLFSCILYLRRVVLCVCDSAQIASHICTYLVPINCTIIVDVQHTFHFHRDFISDPGQRHE